MFAIFMTGLFIVLIGYVMPNEKEIIERIDYVRSGSILFGVFLMALYFKKRLG